MLDSRSLPAGSGLGIVTNAGGPAVLVDYGVDLAKLSDESKSVLNANLPKFWSGDNPVDIPGDADVRRYEVALRRRS